MSALTATDSPARPTARAGGAFTGTGALVRFVLRRERLRMLIWVACLVGGTLATASSLSDQYATRAELSGALASLRSPATLAMTGPAHYLDAGTIGGLLGLQMIGFASVLVALMNILIICRHTRGEEETGRAELIRSAVVGPYAPLAAAVTVAVIADAVLALALAGVSFVLRAAGDARDTHTASWISPIGWAQRTYPFVDDRWWPLLPALALAATTVAIGFGLSRSRDVGAGLRPPRPGRARASRMLATPLGAALRLHRGVIIGFGIGAGVLGVMYGSILGSVHDMVRGNAELSRMLQASGTSITDSFASLILVVFGLIVACFVLIAAARPKAEEGNGRAEPVLSTGLSRAGWLGSHLIVAAGAATGMLLLAGLGFGLTGAASAHDGALVGRLTLAGLAYAPAVWLVLGVAAALSGWLPRFTAAAWIVVVYGFFADYFGDILQLPGWMEKLSPFGRIADLPAAGMAWTPEIVLTLIAAALMTIGLLGLRRRDLQLK